MSHKYKDVQGIAQAVMDRFNKCEVIIITTDAETKKLTITSAGKNKGNKESASKSVMFLKNILGLNPPKGNKK